MNLDSIRKKLTQLQTSTKKSDKLWKPEAGKTQIRIVPYQYNKDNPFVEMYFHYGFGKKTFLSPFTYGNPDPVVEFAEKLKKTGNSDDWKMGRKLDPKMRTYVPVIVRGKESEGVKYWGFGKQVYQELCSFIADEDYGDITDLKSGRDITVEFQIPEEAGNTFGKISVRVKPNPTPVTDNKEILDKILNGQQDLKEIYPEPTYEDLKDALQTWLDGGEPADDTKSSKDSTAKKSAPADDDDEVSYSNKKMAPNPKAEASIKKSSKKSDDVASAFEELFDDK